MDHNATRTLRSPRCDRDRRTRSRTNPILHLETHGSPRGLQLASGDFVTWDHLRPALTDINIAARLNLFVMVAARDGLDLLTILRPTHRATARIIIGPNRTLTDGEVERANLAFYTTLFEMSDGIAAYNAMNDAIEPPSETRQELFTTMSAEVMFYSVMRGYFREYGSEEQIAARVEGLIAPLALFGLGPHELAKRRALGRAEPADIARISRNISRDFSSSTFNPRTASGSISRLSNVGPASRCRMRKISVCG